MAHSRRLYVVHESDLVTVAETKEMIAACNAQVRDHVAPAWYGERVVVEFHTGTLESAQAEVPKGSWVITVQDDPDTAGALGWHWEDASDHIFGRIFAKPCFDAGSTALGGPYAVSSVLSHEVIETYGDPFCNGWSDSGHGYVVAQELCDPVEADSYDINGVPVSNFVLPEWFDPITSAGEKFDYLGKATKPLSMTKGGYWVQMPTGKETQKFTRLLDWEHDVGFDVRGDDRVQVIFSPEMPEWQRDLKMRFGRNVIKRAVAGQTEEGA